MPEKAVKFLWRAAAYVVVGVLENVWFGWIGDELAARWRVRNPSMADVVQALWDFGLPAVTVFLLFAGYHRWYSRYGTENSSVETPTRRIDWNALSSQLKMFRSEGSNAHLLFVEGKRPTVERILSALDLAGWETSFVPSAFDQYPQGGVGKYYSGIEVRGHNRILAEAVTDALLQVGLADVYTTVEPLKMSRENPKWNRLQHRVTIMVGHDKGA
jgi:hypothetical protein